MHVSDRKGLVSIEIEEGEMMLDGGVGVAGTMMDYYSMNYESARDLHKQLGRILDSRNIILDKGLQIMTREKV